MARILTVDDQPHITACLKIFLQRHGHEVHRACNGVLALERLRNESFDVLVTDVDMPEMNGLDLIAHEDAVRDLRVILVLTGRTDYKKLAALQKDPHVHLAPKPFSPSTIASQIEQALSNPLDECNGGASVVTPRPRVSNA